MSEIHIIARTDRKASMSGEFWINEGEDDEEYYEVEFEPYMDEYPSGPYGQGSGSYTVIEIHKITKIVYHPNDPELTQYEEMDLNGDWFKEHREEIEKEMARSIEDWGVDEGI